MVSLYLGENEFDTKADILNTLSEIVNRIDYGYSSGITCNGVCWGIDGEEEPKGDENEWQNL